MPDERPEDLGISDLAARAGVTPRTIRYYLAEGLLPPPGGAGSQRVYGDDHLLRLMAIKRLKEAYLPLSEIRRRLAGLSRAELVQIAEGLTPPDSALDYIASILPAPMARQTRPPEPPLRSQDDPFESPRLSSRQHMFADEEPRLAESFSARGALGPGGDVANLWHRVVLAPGVELHYQPSGDRRRNDAITGLIEIARGLLSNLPSKRKRS